MVLHGYIITLLALLVAKELAGSSQSVAGRRAARVLSIPIAPLMVGFAVVIVVRILDITT